MVLHPFGFEVELVADVLLQLSFDLDAPGLRIAPMLIEEHPSERRDLKAVGRHALLGLSKVGVGRVLAVRVLARVGLGLGPHEAHALPAAGRKTGLEVAKGATRDLLLGDRILVLLYTAEDRAGVVGAWRGADASGPVRVVPRHTDRDVVHG